jgi:hypothetical protein
MAGEVVARELVDVEVEKFDCGSWLRSRFMEILVKG